MSVTNLCNMLTRIDDSALMLHLWERRLGAEIEALITEEKDRDMCPHSHLYLHRGQVRKSLSMWALAIEDYTTALSTLPRALCVLWELCTVCTVSDVCTPPVCLCLCASRVLDVVHASLTRSDLKHDLDYMIYYYRGQCHELMNNLRAAQEDYTSSIKANPFYADPLSNRAHIYASLGNTAGALVVRLRPRVRERE